MRIFYRDWVTNAMEKLGMTEGQEIESKMVTRAIARAQKKVEDRNFEIRKSLLEYDEVMDRQRKTIYGVRQSVLEGEGLKDRVVEMLGGTLSRSVVAHAEDPKGLRDWSQRTFGFEISSEHADLALDPERPDLEPAIQSVVEAYDRREASLGEELMRRVESYLLLNAIDGRWKDHLHAVDALKAGIGLRGYGQIDPKVEYKREGTKLFEENLIPAIEDEVSSLVMRIEVRRPEESAATQQAQSESGALTPRGMGPGAPAQNAPSPQQVAAYGQEMRKRQAQQAMRSQVPASSAFDVMRRNQQRQQTPAPAAEAEEQSRGAVPERDPAYEGVGRNDPCPCGSGKKFKKCHATAT
jgi:preprotein translocase subunit SecA